MWFLRTAGWLTCVVYSTIPLFWFMIHPRAQAWRVRRRSPFRVLLPAWIGMWIAVGALTAHWRTAQLYSTPWMWLPAALLFAAGASIYKYAGAHFSWSQLGGLPEVHAGNEQQRLITTGIRARVRHPIYLGHLCEMLAWSFGTGLVVCCALTAFAIVTGAVMVGMEDAELERRFGKEYRTYQDRVPAVLPKLNPAHNIRPRMWCDGVAVGCEVPGEYARQIAIADLMCLAEYTNSRGPFADDYHLVFVLRSGPCSSMSFYSEGRDEALRRLGAALGCELNLSLVNSTASASRIVWPKQLEGYPLFVGKAINPEVERLTEARQL